MGHSVESVSTPFFRHLLPQPSPSKKVFPLPGIPLGVEKSQISLPGADMTFTSFFALDEACQLLWSQVGVQASCQLVPERPISPASWKARSCFPLTHILELLAELLETTCHIGEETEALGAGKTKPRFNTVSFVFVFFLLDLLSHLLTCT